METPVHQQENIVSLRTITGEHSHTLRLHPFNYPTVCLPSPPTHILPFNHPTVCLPSPPTHLHPFNYPTVYLPSPPTHLLPFNYPTVHIPSSPTHSTFTPLTIQPSASHCHPLTSTPLTTCLPPIVTHSPWASLGTRCIHLSTRDPEPVTDLPRSRTPGDGWSQSRWSSGSAHSGCRRWDSQVRICSGLCV